MARIEVPSALPLCAFALLAGVAIPATIPSRLGAQAQVNEQAEEPTPEQSAAMRSETIEKLKRLGIALRRYHDDKKSFPPPAIKVNGIPVLSWRVAILPYLEDEHGDNKDVKSLYEQFDLTQPWDGPQNKPLTDKMPDVFRCPVSKSPAGSTVYQVPRGDRTLFPAEKPIRVRDISDGLSNTIAVVEVNDAAAVAWTKPDNWQLDLSNPISGLGGHFDNVFYALFCDGAVRAIPVMVKPDLLNALFTPAGGELVVLPD